MVDVLQKYVNMKGNSDLRKNYIDCDRVGLFLFLNDVLEL